jgi:hypothetical protein
MIISYDKYNVIEIPCKIVDNRSQYVQYFIRKPEHGMFW